MNADENATVDHFIEGIVEGADTSVNTDDLPYRLFIPRNYDPKKKYPLIYFFHGAGEVGTNNRDQLDIIQDELVFVNAANRLNHPAFMLAPQTPVGTWVDSLRQTQKEALLTTITSTYNIDPKRIYVTGESLGGNSTWDFANRNPGLVAAVAPLCGWGPKSNLTGVPLWTFHAANDGTVSISQSSGTDPNIAALRASGSNPIYTRYDNGSHAIWDDAYATPQFIEWVFAQRKGQQPLTTPFIEPRLVRVGSTLSISGVAGDATSAITGVAWTTATGGSGNATGTTAWSINGIPLQAGSNLATVTATGTDYSAILGGGKTTFNTTVKVNGYVIPVGDTEAPILAITAPTLGDQILLTSQSTLSVSGTQSDNITVTQLAWSNDRGGSGAGSIGAGTWSASGIPLLPGTNYITITASDSAGNYAKTFYRVRQNQAPSAAPDTYNSYTNVTADLRVIDNDSDADESPDVVRLLSVGAASHGTTRVYDGAVRYVPDGGFTGTDSFQYTITDGLATSSASVTINVGGTFPVAETVIFQQDFSSSSDYTTYFSAASPGANQWNDISTEQDGGDWSIESGVLKLVKENGPSPNNGAGLARWTDLAPAPQVFRFNFDVAMLNTPNISNGLGTLDIGSLGSAFLDYNSGGVTAGKAASLEISGDGTNKFRFNLASSKRGSYLSDGTYRSVAWYVNTTTTASLYLDPDGAARILNPNAQSLFVDKIPLFENVPRVRTNTSPVDMRLLLGSSGSSIMLFDNIRFVKLQVVSPPTDPYDTWFAGSFTPAERADASVSGELADPDQDGAPNIWEYARGTAPKQATLPEDLQPLVEEDHLSIQFWRDPNRTDVNYEVVASGNLESNDWTPIARSVAGGPTSDVGAGTAFIEETGSSPVTVTVGDAVDSGQQSHRFLRLRISRALVP